MAHQVFRRGIFATSSPYADITATSPDLLVPLLYASTSADGQILYEDSGLTTPVDANGEPIGGVDWADNTVAIQQATDADRPVWRGESDGAEFDGTSDHLTAGGVSDFNFLHNTGGSIFATVQSDVLTGDQVIAGNLNTSSNGILFRVDDNDGGNRRLRIIVFVEGSPAINATSDLDPLSDNNQHVVGVVYDFSGAAFYVDGVAYGTATYTASGTANNAGNVMEVGRNPAGEVQHWDGKMKAVTIHDAQLTGSTLADLQSALAAL